MESIEAGSLSDIRQSSPERPSVWGNAPFERPEARSPDMPPPRLFSRDKAAAPREIEPTRPTTAQIYLSYTTPSQNLLYDSYEMASYPSGFTAERPSSTSHVTNLEAIREAAADHETPPQRTGSMALQDLSASHPNVHSSSSTSDPINLALLSSNPAEPRPTTARSLASRTTAMPETLEYEIPPRRELPFGRPESRSSGSGQPRFRPSTSALTLPPLPKPTPARDGSISPIRPKTASPTKNAVTSRPTTVSPLKRSLAAQEDQPSPTRAAPPSARVGSPDPPPRKTSRMDELLYGRKPLAERSTNVRVPRLNSLADAPHETVSPPATAQRSPMRANAGDDHTVGAYTALRSPTRHPQEVSLQEYAGQSREDRQAALDEFMIENLENPGFTKLCEDVENCWRRIVLGL